MPITATSSDMHPTSCRGQQPVACLARLLAMYSLLCVWIDLRGISHTLKALRHTCSCDTESQRLYCNRRMWGDGSGRGRGMTAAEQHACPQQRSLTGGGGGKKRRRGVASPDMVWVR
jgi:hypothetical protein